MYGSLIQLASFFGIMQVRAASSSTISSAVTFHAHETPDLALQFNIKFASSNSSSATVINRLTPCVRVGRGQAVDDYGQRIPMTSLYITLQLGRTALAFLRTSGAVTSGAEHNGPVIAYH